jgi:hypothetical protein
MIKTEEFPREKWEGYLNQLTAEAQKHLMTVRVEAESLGDQVLADGLPLVAISLEQKGSERGNVEIIAERDDGTHLTHLISEPEHIYLARYDDKSEVCLDVEDRSGAKTLVFVH